MWNPDYYFNLFLSFYERHRILVWCFVLAPHFFMLTIACWRVPFIGLDPTACVSIYMSDHVILYVLTCVILCVAMFCMCVMTLINYSDIRDRVVQRAAELRHRHQLRFCAG